jgi:hypothetical protein
MFKYAPNEVGGYSIIADTYEWTNIKGLPSGVKLRFDPNKEEGVNTNLIKSSLEVSLIRLNQTDFQDIISAEENEYMGIIIEQDSPLATGPIYWDANYQPYLKPNENGAKCIFKGTLTLETYGEAYTPFAEVKLIFHDKIGELKDLLFYPKKTFDTLTSILGEVLRTVTVSENLFLEYPFDIEDGFYSNLKSPEGIILDTSVYNRKSKLDLLVEILTAHFSMLYCDFAPMRLASIDSEPVAYLQFIGAIRIECTGTRNNPTVEYHKLELQKTTYNSIDQYIYFKEDSSSSGNSSTLTREERPIFIMDTDTLPISGLSGYWQLVRKAKYIEGVNNFGLKESIFYPVTLELEDFDANPDSENSINDLVHKYWRKYIGSITYSIVYNAIKSFFIDERTLPLALGATLNNDGLLGVLAEEYQNPLQGQFLFLPPSLLIIESGATLTINISAVPVGHTTQIGVGLIARLGNLLYTYDNSLGWITYYSSSSPVVAYTLNLLNLGQETTGTKTGISFPPFRVGTAIEITAFAIWSFSGSPVSGDYLYVTDLKVKAVSVGNYPRKLSIKTILSESRRTPVTFEGKFYNLPSINGRFSLYHSGILATGLDYKVDESGEELNSDNIIAPSAFLYKGNNATLLVHVSDMLGVNHMSDRWEFNADILPLTDEPSTGADIETAEYTAITLSSITCGGKNIIGWSNVSEYGVYTAKVSGGAWTKHQFGTTLTDDTFSGVASTGLVPDELYYYKAYMIIDGETYYGQRRKITTVAPVLETIDGTSTASTTIGTTGGIRITGNSFITEYGMYYATNVNGPYTKQKKGNTLAYDSFPATITGLVKNTTYYYKAYVIINGKTYYGNIQTDTTKDLYTLTLSTCGDSTGTGTQSKNPSQATYEYGTSVIITAEPDIGVFDSWKKAGVHYSYNNPITIVIDGNMTFCAKFTSL